MYLSALADPCVITVSITFLVAFSLPRTPLDAILYGLCSGFPLPVTLHSMLHCCYSFTNLAVCFDYRACAWGQ